MKAVALLLLFFLSCATRRPLGTFQVLPASPHYLLRSPDSSDTPFPETLSRYNSFVLGSGWFDLRPQMDLRIENAYYQEGASRRGLQGFLGTEVARYRVRPNGELRLGAVQPLRERPPKQPPIQELITPAQRQFRHHRFFYAVVFKQRGDARGSVLLGAKSADDLDRLAKQLLIDPDAACGAKSANCTVFPSACTVSVEMEITVNGAPRTVPWASLLAAVTQGVSQPKVFRNFQGRRTLIEVDPDDPNARRLPLLPGDEVSWEITKLQ